MSATLPGCSFMLFLLTCCSTSQIACLCVLHHVPWSVPTGAELFIAELFIGCLCVPAGALWLMLVARGGELSLENVKWLVRIIMGHGDGSICSLGRKRTPFQEGVVHTAPGDCRCGFIERAGQLWLPPGSMHLCPQTNNENCNIHPCSTMSEQ